jgi:AcrR family transcriptional regulator
MGAMVQPVTADAVDAPRAGGYARGRATRGLVVDAAMELFGEVGYRAASLREIAARSGITHPGLLHHFPTKAALLSAVLARRDEQDTERYPLTGPAVDQLRSLIGLVQHNVDAPALVELHAILSAEATDPGHPAHAWCVARYVETRRLFRQAFERAAVDGVLHADVDPATAAVALAALMDGLQVQWLLDRSSVDMVAVVRDHLNRLVSVDL